MNFQALQGNILNFQDNDTDTIIVACPVTNYRTMSTAAVQGNHIVLKALNSNSFIIETSQDKRCTSPTPNVTTNTP